MYWSMEKKPLEREKKRKDGPSRVDTPTAVFFFTSQFIVGSIIVIGAVVAVPIYMRRKKMKKATDPGVQFTSATEVQVAGA